jgi:hypothetical protein
MQGRLDEVSDLLAPYAGHFEVCEQVARLHLLRDEPDLAAEVINRGLHDLVGDRLRAGRLLELLVEVELARDNPEGAELALERLEACALASESPALRAAVSLSEGRVSMLPARQWESAVAALNDALDILGTEERPIMAGPNPARARDPHSRTRRTPRRLSTRYAPRWRSSSGLALVGGRQGGGHARPHRGCVRSPGETRPEPPAGSSS